MLNDERLTKRTETLLAVPEKEPNQRIREGKKVRAAREKTK